MLYNEKALNVTMKRYNVLQCTAMEYNATMSTMHNEYNETMNTMIMITMSTM